MVSPFLRFADGRDDLGKLAHLWLDRVPLGLTGVGLDAVLERLEKIVGTDLAQHVYLDATRFGLEDRGGCRDLGREIERGDVDVDEQLLAQARAVQHQIAAGHGGRVGELHAFDLDRARGR